MSIHEISARLTRSGIQHVVVTAADKDAARLATIKTQIMVKAVGATDIEKAVRIAHDIKALLGDIGFDSTYRVDALKAASELSNVIKIYESLLQDPKFAKYEKILANTKAHFSRISVAGIYASLADIVLAVGKHYEDVSSR